jgi:hypothetical protein
MNYRVIDGDDQYLERVPEFIKLYENRQYTVPDILEEMNIPRNIYKKLRKHCIEENLIRLRRKPNKKKPTYKQAPKHYSCTHCKGIEYYAVHKRINGVPTYFGTFRKARQAERMVELLEECDWDYSRRYELKEQVMNEGI